MVADMTRIDCPEQGVTTVGVSRLEPRVRDLWNLFRGSLGDSVGKMRRAEQGVLLVIG